jgi:hypothetical protein
VTDNGHSISVRKHTTRQTFLANNYPQLFALFVIILSNKSYCSLLPFTSVAPFSVSFNACLASNAQGACCLYESAFACIQDPYTFFSILNDLTLYLQCPVLNGMMLSSMEHFGDTQRVALCTHPICWDCSHRCDGSRVSIAIYIHVLSHLPSVFECNSTTEFRVKHRFPTSIWMNGSNRLDYANHSVTTPESKCFDRHQETWGGWD